MYSPVLDNTPFPYAVGKCVCVGRNYAAHAAELNNPVPSVPLLFIKPADSVVTTAPQISIPAQRGSVHHELEIAVLIQHRLKNATETEAKAAIAGIGLRSEEHTSELQSRPHLVCRLLLEKKKKK